MIRIKELDVLRGFAALNVVIFHYTTRFESLFGNSSSHKYDWEYGQYGVELFFIISGFVIFMTLQDINTIQEFAYKRFIRLYPTYWICMLITVLITSIYTLPGRKFTSFEAIINLTMIQSLFNVRNVDGVYWSLFPELLFYGMMGLVFQLRLLNNIRAFAFIWLTLMLLDKQFALPFGAYVLNLKYGMFFLAGILFYRLKFENGGIPEHILIVLCYLVAVLVHPGSECIFIFAIIFSLFYLFTYGKLELLNNKPMIFLGYISYPLYLLHQNIGYVLINNLNRYFVNEIFSISISVISMIGLAWLVTEFLEKPIIKLLRNFYYRNKKVQASGSLTSQVQLGTTIRYFRPKFKYLIRRLL